VTADSLPIQDNDNGVTRVTPSREKVNAVAEATGNMLGPGVVPRAER
jgi:hypothetical protein